MDFRAALVGLTMMAVALSGCSGGGDDGPSASEKCEMDDMLWTGDACIAHTEPSVVLNGLGESAPAFTNVPFTWTLNNGTRGGEVAVHSMDSRIVANTETTIPTNATSPDEYGTEIAKVEHQNLPIEHDGEFIWETPGDTVSLWGYMLIDGEHVWNALGQISITDVLATGTTHTVTLSAGPPPTSDAATLSVKLGDAVQFANSLPVPTVMSYTISFDCSNGVSISSQTIDASSSGTAIQFTLPTSCDWTANSAASASGEDPFAITGKINTQAP